MTSELLKEAIADAKAVRATALANAKAALEEAFTPKLQSMLAEKLREETEEQEEGKMEESSHIGSGDNEIGTTTKKPHMDKITPNAGKDCGLVTGVKLDEEQEEGREEEVTSAEIDEILSELEQEAGQEVAPVAPEGDAVAPVAPTGDAVAPVAPPIAAPIAPVAQAPVAPVDGAVAPATEPVAPPAGEEEINLDELLSALSEATEEEESVKEGKLPPWLKKKGEKDDEKKEDDNDEDDKKKEVDENLVKELNEYRKTVEFLREQLSEVNLLNAKLLYTNKLFKGNALNNTQKMKVIEQFDLTKSIREVKLTYANMQEAFNLGSGTSKKSPITEGLASKPTATTKPSDKIVLAEANDMAARFKTLAGIKSKK